jgi:hypothetical protein
MVAPVVLVVLAVAVMVDSGIPQTLPQGHETGNLVLLIAAAVAAAVLEHQIKHLAVMVVAVVLVS